MNISEGRNEKEGLMPVTIGMINEASRKEDKLEYLGVTIGEITFVGFVVLCEEKDTKIVIGVWDQTGYKEVFFFNKSENESHSGLAGFSMKEKCPVRIFGKVKYYKEEKRIDGSKILEVDMNEFIYHKITLLNDWMYLTNSLREDEVKYKNSDMSNIKSNKKSGLREQVLMIVERIDKSKGFCVIDDILKEFNKSELDVVKDTIDRLLSECAIMEDGGQIKLV